MAKKNNFDSDFCGSLPLNHINVIQDYGYLIVLEKSSLKIIQISENLGQLLDKELAELIGNTLSDFTDIVQLRDLQLRFEGKSKDKIPLTLTLQGAKMLAFAHFKADYVILELESPELVIERSFSNVYEEVKYATAAIEAAETIEEVSSAAVHELKKLTGFDGIMMYKFDTDWNGKVIAQEKSDPALEDYLGHTFPASDIPKQARELYLKNPYRLIPNRDYKPLRLYPIINSTTNSFIDLSDCNLRGVAAVHLEYLKNMNVQSSMSIRVIHNGVLWGLIACHHVTPHYLNFELCSICELISTAISNRLTTIIYKQNFDRETELQSSHNTIVTKIFADNDLLSGLFDSEQPTMMTMFQATGLAVTYNGRLEISGKVPDTDTIDNLVLWLQSKEVTEVFSTDHLPEIFEEAAAISDDASGVVVIPIDKDKGSYIFCFRPEIVQTINWGGNPNNAINFEPDGKKYHPRASFKIWKQKIHQTSQSWSTNEIKAAENLRNFICEFTTKQQA